MSYSFSVKASNKAAALEQISAEIDKVAASQPVHAADRAQALAAASAMLEVLPEAAEGQEITGSIAGWLSWNGSYPDSHVINQVNVSVTLKVTSV